MANIFYLYFIYIMGLLKNTEILFFFFLQRERAFQVLNNLGTNKLLEYNS